MSFELNIRMIMIDDADGAADAGFADEDEFEEEDEDKD